VHSSASYVAVHNAGGQLPGGPQQVRVGLLRCVSYFKVQVQPSWSI